MKKSKLILIIVSVIIIVALTVLSIAALPWLIIYCGIWLSPNPPEPQITYAEFPFELTYSLNGETFTINDVYVCEYDGIDIDEGQGKHIEWNGYIKSSNKEYPVLLVDDNKKIICGDIGSPEYYMGDPDYFEIYGSDEIVPNLVMWVDTGDITSFHIMSDDEQKEYNIELIGWKLSKPINNTFE